MPLCQEEYLLCSSCQSKNVAGRLNCWRCGGDLPRRAQSARPFYDSFDSLSHPDPVPAPWSQAALEELLSQAVVIDLSRPGRFSTLRRKAFAARAAAIRGAARREKRPLLPRRARINMARRAATALSLTLLTVAAASGPIQPIRAYTAPRKSRSQSGFAHKTALASAPQTEIAASASSNFSLEAEQRKIQADLDSRKRDFLTTGLNMVRDYEAAHGSLIPDPTDAQAAPNASYPAYVARMKFLLIKEGVI